MPADAVRKGFVTGLVLVAPLAITVWVALFVYGLLLGLVQPFVSFAIRDNPLFQVLAVVCLFVLVTVLGLVVRRGIGWGAFTQFDEGMERIPVLRAVYSSARQASNAIVGREGQFERTVIVEWPREGAYTLGFVTNDTPDRVSRELADRVDSERCYNVFVPMSPNPMGGFLAVFPESDIVATELTVKEGLQMVITTGMTGEERVNLEELTGNGGSVAAGT
ncbi:DUF502 domain-containing protein [Halomarina litorea]|uniref:DUF502 domain-containing protein n=1 Tax=Halomarina litorea TaxID=2961595 RepID=UPI0020C1BF86|nr:DUF502 domain-containing protein [Halomarina sp. BCD28]